MPFTKKRPEGPVRGIKQALPLVVHKGRVPAASTKVFQQWRRTELLPGADTMSRLGGRLEQGGTWLRSAQDRRKAGTSQSSFKEVKEVLGKDWYWESLC